MAGGDDRFKLVELQLIVLPGKCEIELLPRARGKGNAANDMSAFASQKQPGNSDSGASSADAPPKRMAISRFSLKTSPKTGPPV